MKQKQKKGKKFAALCSVLILLLSCVWTSPVYAEEQRDLFVLQNQMEADATFFSEISNNLTDTNADSADSVTPVFGLLITNGEKQIITSAFYVRDTFGDGSTYLVSIADALVLMEDGFDVFLIGTDGFKVEVTGGSVCSEEGYAFLQADGLNRYTPMEMTENVSEADPGILYFAADNSKLYTAYEELDMSDWQLEGAYYTGNYKLKNIVQLGAPAVDLQSAQVWGMMNMADNAAGVIVDANQIEFKPEAAIVRGEDVPSGGAAGGFSSNPWVIAALVGGVIGIVIRKKKKGSKKNSGQEAAAKDNGTVILQEDRKMDALDMHTGISAEEAAAMKDYDSLGVSGSLPRELFYDMTETQPVQAARYQLRGMSGTFKGQIFEVNGTMKIGRDPLCGIAYPQETGGISGNHCLVMEEAEGVLLRDLNSTYGTFCNGVKMHPQMDYHLAEGDTFYLADPKYTFRVERAGECRQEFTPVVKAVTAPVTGKLYRANVNREIYFGRGHGTQVQFGESDTKISTKHCVLYRDNTGLYLMDLGSTNGTFMSETLRLKPNVPYRMEKGSAFFLASPKYTFVVTEE